MLGDTAAATEYRRLAAELATVTWDRWRDHALTSQTGCALAVVFDLAPSHDLPAVAGRLAELVRGADGAVSTGFLGTPLVLPALARFDHFDEAYLMLLRTEVRSWLYQVLMGAPPPGSAGTRSGPTARSTTERSSPTTPTPATRPTTTCCRSTTTATAPSSTGWCATPAASPR